MFDYISQSFTGAAAAAALCKVAIPARLRRRAQPICHCVSIEREEISVCDTPNAAVHCVRGVMVVEYCVSRFCVLFCLGGSVIFSHSISFARCHPLYLLFLGGVRERVRRLFKRLASVSEPRLRLSFARNLWRGNYAHLHFAGNIECVFGCVCVGIVALARRARPCTYSSRPRRESELF